MYIVSRERVLTPSVSKNDLNSKWVEDGGKLDVSTETLFERVNDLAGVRLIHLHTEQMVLIHPAVLAVFTEHNYRLFEEPTANIWDVFCQHLLCGYRLSDG